ncbi:hypothetical protein [Tessaracoccus defluvii]|uniref:Twin-arginine translocation signal domain-containing protein n=1 Tax=Tessaracoccus defluvii TaxID=1285901 RepID=A0A7H0H3C2_9ACTN|nr:hypothetical protein [Tessaracoccus defluvii]QNP55038.1 hypothetical protein H9L22_12245 [Tessaracoccus defluvii]
MLTRSADFIERRRFMKGAAWVAPVVVVAVAAPAAAASAAILDEFRITVYDLENRRDDGTAGPLVWAGFNAQRTWSDTEVPATVSYVAILTGPGGLKETFTGAAELLPIGTFELLDKVVLTKARVVTGTYTLTLTMTVEGHLAKTASSSVTV